MRAPVLVFHISILNPYGNIKIEHEVHVPFFDFLFPNTDFQNREIDGCLYPGIPKSPFRQMVGFYPKFGLA